MPPPRPAFSKCNLAFKYLPRVWLSFPILVRHRVHAQPHRHQLVVHISYAEVFVARFLVALLTSFYLIQRCSSPLAGVSAGERCHMSGSFHELPLVDVGDRSPCRQETHRNYPISINLVFYLSEQLRHDRSIHLNSVPSKALFGLALSVCHIKNHSSYKRFILSMSSVLRTNKESFFEIVEHSENAVSINLSTEIAYSTPFRWPGKTELLG